MIKDNQKKLNGFHVVLDGLVIIASYALAWFILLMGNRLFSPEKKLLAPQYYFAALIIRSGCSRGDMSSLISVRPI